MDHYFTNNGNLKDDKKNIVTLIMETKMSLVSDSGVFSKDKVDYGTRLLLDNLPLSKIKGNILDLGCGYGVVGIFIKKNIDVTIDMVDINERALVLAKRNIELNSLRDIRVFVSDAYSNITGKYDYIITNPPIRAGKSKVLEFLLGAVDHLNKEGELWFVMRKDHGVKTIIKLMEESYNIEIVEKDKGFYIVKATTKNMHN